MRTGQEIDGLLTSATGSEAFVVVNDPLTVLSRNRIAFFALQRRIPIMLERRSGLYGQGMFLEVGPNVQEMYAQAAAQIDKIVRGARPVDVPMESPAKMDLVVNLKTARAIGLTIPQSVLMQATQLIQ